MELIKNNKHPHMDIVRFDYNFGMGFAQKLKSIFGSKKHEALFIEAGNSSMEFYAYFSLEIYETLNAFTMYFQDDLDINTRVIARAMFELEQTDLLSNSHLSTGAPEKAIKELEEISESQLNLGLIESVMNFGILDHQRIAFVNYVMMKDVGLFRGFMLAADPGTGKTYMSIALTLALQSDVVVVVAPKPTLDEVWVDSVTGEMFKKPQSYWLSTGGTKYKGEKYIITHYEFIPKLKDYIKIEDGKKVAIVVDESHNFNEHVSGRTQQLSSFINQTDPADVILLSGTPIKANANEVGALLYMVDKKFQGEIADRFFRLYKSPNGLLMKTIPLRYRDIETFISKSEMKLPPMHTLNVDITLENGKYWTLVEVKKRLTEYVKVRTKELTKELPKIHKRYESARDEAFKLSNSSPADFKHYKDNISQIMEKYENGGLMEISDVMGEANAYEKNMLMPHLRGEDLANFRSDKSVVKYLALKVQGEALARVVMKGRIDAHADMAKVIDYEKLLNTVSKKMLVFSSYADVCEVAFKECEKFTKPLAVWGDETKHLSATVRKFHEDKDSDVLVTTYKSLSTGVPVTCANMTIFIDVPFRMYIYTQAIARTHRLGQDSPVKIVQLTLNTGDEPNINSRNIDILEWSKDMVEHITGKEIDVDIQKSGQDEAMDMLSKFSPGQEMVAHDFMQWTMSKGKDITQDILDFFMVK